jgi:hypothetical protein
MLMWVNLMTQDSPIKPEVSSVICKNLVTPSPPETPSEQNVRTKATPEFTTSSPWSSYLYNQPRTSSPYSTFFDNSLHGSNHDYSGYPSVNSDCFSDFSTPDTSRPSSRLSNHHLNSNHPTYSDLSLNYTDSASLTSPGRIIPINSTPCRSPTIPRPNQGKIFSVLYRPDLIKLSFGKNRKKFSSSDYLYPEVIEEHKHDLSLREPLMRDEEKTFKSSTNIQLKRNSNCLPFHIGQFEVQKSSEKSLTSLDEKCVDEKQENANKVSLKQTLSNNSEVLNALQVVFHHNPKENSKNSNNGVDLIVSDENNLSDKSVFKDNFFDKLLNDIEESIKDM